MSRGLFLVFGLSFVAAPLSAQTPEIQKDIDGRLRAIRAAQIVAPAPAQMIHDEAAVRSLVAKIDRRLDDFWAQNNIKPSEPATDAEFLRRLSLDLTGKIPSVQEVRRFLADTDSRKREKKVAELLNKPLFLDHFAAVLRQQWIPQATDNQRFDGAGNQFEMWLLGRLRENAGLDKIVGDVLTAPTLFARTKDGVQLDPDRTRTAFAFNQVNEFKPENVASSASRLFMGVKMECAQCHDHPFAPISREQFWETAAFFADVQPAIANSPEAKLKREIKIADNDPKKVKLLQARFFDDTEPQWKEDGSPRAVFVAWLVAPENKYFARNSVQRLWAHFFGIGFIDPIDEPGIENPELVPELVDDLAKAFVESNYDMRFLMKAVVRSKAYQLTSRQTDPSQGNPRQFARMTVKALTAEQLFDSLVQATGFNEGNRAQARNAFSSGPRRDFLTKFASTEKITERQTSILQALTLMNGNFVADQTSLSRSAFLSAIAEAPFMDSEAKVETLFLATLSRLPSAEEVSKFASHVERGGADGDKKKALTDVFWALLNSSEFILNH